MFKERKNNKRVGDYGLFRNNYIPKEAINHPTNLL
jgi:hypothetical protein